MILFERPPGGPSGGSCGGLFSPAGGCLVNVCVKIGFLDGLRAPQTKKINCGITRFTFHAHALTLISCYRRTATCGEESIAAARRLSTTRLMTVSGNVSRCT